MKILIKIFVLFCLTVSYFDFLNILLLFETQKRKSKCVIGGEDLRGGEGGDRILLKYIACKRKF